MRGGLDAGFELHDGVHRGLLEAFDMGDDRVELPVEEPAEHPLGLGHPGASRHGVRTVERADGEERIDRGASGVANEVVLANPTPDLRFDVRSVRTIGVDAPPFGAEGIVVGGRVAVGGTVAHAAPHRLDQGGRIGEEEGSPPAPDHPCRPRRWR